MKLERLLIVSACVVGTAGLLAINLVGANATRQGDGALAQEPMHLGSSVAPNFIMAIDDSGSMTFQTLFPGTDGQACWDASNATFFNADGSLRTTANATSTGNATCSFHYVMQSLSRAGSTYYGIPPLDQFGFARSPDFNPQFYSPDQTYTPWIDDVVNAAKDGLESFPAATTDTTRISPLETDEKKKVALFGMQSTPGSTLFRMQRNMVIPKGVKYQTCKSWSTNNNNCSNDSWNAVRDDGLKWDSNTPQDVLIAFNPSYFYLKQERTIEGYTAAVKIDNACGAGCALYRYEPNDPKTKQNFANWFSFYGNRNRAMIAGLTLSLNDVKEKLRVGYFTINKTDIFDRMRNMETLEEKRQLIGKVLELGAKDGTPNRAAVAKIGELFNDKSKGIIEHACQKNAGMLFTDGYSNGGGPKGIGDKGEEYAGVDSTMGVPFKDSYDYTLADIAAYYYNTQLRKDITAGKVPVSDPALCESGTELQKRGLDCQTNLHMNFYGITLGAKGKLFGVTYGPTGAEATAQALAGSTSPKWEARTDGSPNTVDEIWHATMNARGQYINARTPAAITTAMRNVLASVGVASGVSGSLAITGTRLGDASLSVTPRFNRAGTDWYGDIVASKPARTVGTDGKASFTYSTIWSASAKLPAAADRKLYYGVVSSDGTTTAKSFTSEKPTGLADLCANYPSDSCSLSAGAIVSDLGVSIDEAVSYLAGDRTLEASKLRKRTSPLGDIINSSPIVSAGTDDYGYALIRKSDGSFEYDPYGYTKYLESKSKRGRMVYVGANDGMMHAFDGETGKETFAYIPASAVGYLGNLLFPTSPSFQHRYLVDGPVVVSDALQGTTWKTVLVGTSGAGARSVFGLDVTTPGSFSKTDVLWEVNDKISGGVGDRIGYVLGKPVIVPVRGAQGKPEWKAIFGAGYGNKLNAADDTRGTVTLFVVDMMTGKVSYIDAKEEGASVANGLGSVVAIDRYQFDSKGARSLGSDGMVDTVYGGDLQGNVWKFDLTTSKLAYEKPVFTATDGTSTDKRQAITGGFEAAVGPRGGVMLFFGTGSFSFDNDKSNKDIQTAYGVLDMGGEETLPLTRANLQKQSLAANNGITSTSVNYYTQRGWYLDLGVVGSDGKLDAKGERMVGYPKIEGGTLYFTSYAPEVIDGCSGGGNNFLYGLNALTGAGALGIVKVGDPNGTSLGEGTGRLGLTTDGAAPVKDVSVFTTGKQSGLGGTPDDAAIAKDKALDPEYCMAIVSVAGSAPLYRVRPCGRQSWRQIR